MMAVSCANKKSIENKRLNYGYAVINNLKVSSLALIITTVISNPAWSDDTFNKNALEIDNPTSMPIDLSVFSKEEGQLPGTYPVDVYLNDNFQKTESINFISNDQGILIPQLSLAMLDSYGLNVKAISNFDKLDQNKPISEPDKIIPGFQQHYDFGKNRLNISIPQALMKMEARGAIDPKYWDEGLTAAILGYNFTGSQTWRQSEEDRSDNYFTSLHSGFNFDGWRVRNYSTWNYNKSDDASTESWDSINTWAQHDVKSIQGQLVVGESYTPSDVFDSAQFKGIQLASDDNMLADSQRGFAPTIRGIANSNAQVTVKQNGVVIYQSYVSPGAFVINDLFPTSSSGDLQVEIKEADGSVRNFTQPFSGVPVMQREGHLKYSVTGGKYRSATSDGEEPGFGQITMLYGLPHSLTIYGGNQSSENYLSFALGLGASLGEIGSISVDATEAKTHLKQNDEDHEGQSYRFQYSKDIQTTDTTVTVAGYRYSTSGYYTFNEANDFYSDDDYNLNNIKKSKFQVSIAQEINDGDWGGFSLSGWQQTYWGSSKDEKGASLSYNNNIGAISYSLMYTYSKSGDPEFESNDQQFSMNISVPLSKWLPRTYASYSLNSTKGGDTSQRVGLNGTALENSNLSWSAAQGYTNHGSGSNGQLSSDYKGTYGEVNGGYNYDQDSRQVNYGLAGGIVVHPYGVTLSQPFNGDLNSMVLVKASGADNVNIENSVGVKTDWRGYTVVPYISPYKKTQISLKNKDLGNDVDIENNAKSVIPTEGALVLAEYNTHIGSRVLMTLSKQDHTPVPFGSTVVLNGDDRENIVGENGEVYLSGVKPKDKLQAVWGHNASQSCVAEFTLPIDNKMDIKKIDVICN